MIADYYKAIQKDETKRVLPAKVVRELNKQLPKGYEYIIDDKGNCIVKPVQGKTEQTITGIINYSRSSIPKKIKQDQVADYAYRTQKKIFLDNVKVIEDGRTIDFNDLNKDPITGKQTEISSDFVLIPEPFPSAIPMTFVTYEGQEVIIYFQRVPYDNMQFIKFENASFPALKMITIVPDKDNQSKTIPASINISVTPSKAETVEDAILSLKILKSFAQRKLKINNTLVGADLSDGRTSKLNNEELDNKLVYWEGVRKIEILFNAHFNPGAEFPDEERKLLDELFFCFLEDKEMIYTKPFEQFHIGINNKNDSDKLTKNIVGKPGLPLLFLSSVSATLLDAKIRFYQASVLVDMTIDKVITDDDGRGANLFIIDAPNTQFKMIRKFYQTEEEAKNGATCILNKYSTYNNN